MNTAKPQLSARLKACRAAALLAGIIVSCGHLPAQSVVVPNFSFESQVAPNTPPYVNIFVDAWQKAPEPAYYGPAIGTPFGIPWLGTAGVFFDTNPYGNRLGLQAGYILGFPQVTLFQDYNSSPTHDFNAVFEVGKSYNLTVGLFGKNTLAPGSSLQLGLYYRNDQNEQVTVNSTTVLYSMAAFPTNLPLNLVDYAVNIPTVLANDPWAGKNIGIQLLSTTPLELSTGGNWDFDNVRLSAIPEPAPLGLLVGGIGLVLTWVRSRRS